MKRLFLTVALLAAVAGCNSSTGDDDSTGGAGSHALYPLTQNATWTFASNVTVPGYTPYDETVTNRATRTVLIDGRTYWELTTTTLGESTPSDSIYVRVEDNILYSYGNDFIAAKPVLKAAGHARAVAALSAFRPAAETSDHPLLKLNVPANTTWDVYRYIYESGTDSATWIAVGTYLGTETVGSYANCAVFTVTEEMEIVSGTESVAVKIISSYWLAPNVGPAKVLRMYFLGDRLDTVELYVTTTNILTSHTTP